MKKLNKKFENFIFKKIKDLNNLKILEFGVQRGYSTKIFIDFINKNGGELYSIDIDDCSNISRHNKWTFIQSRDDNFKLIKKKYQKK